MKNLKITIFTIALLLLLGKGILVQADQNVADNKTEGLKPLTVEVVPPSQESQIFKEEMDAVGAVDASDTEYGKYATDYYYNQLSDAKRALWDKLDAMCLVYLTNTINADNNRTNYVTYSGLSRDEAVSTVQLFRYSNPQYYFLNLSSYLSYTDTDGMVALSVFSAFADGTARAAATTSMFQSVATALSYMKAGDTTIPDIQKEKLAHDWIVAKVIYDPNYNNSLANTYNQVAYSVFNTGSTVCAGYSQAMQLLSNAAGIDCAVVTSSSHEWNIIRLNDTWYYLDLTWNDMDGSQGYVTFYTYFNRSYNRIRSLDSGGAHVAEPLYTGLLPTSTKDSGATSSEIGTIFQPADTWSAPAFRFSGGKATITGSTGSKIYYTVTGSQPAVASAKAKVYSGSFNCPVGTTVVAMAAGDGKWDSAMAVTTAVAESPSESTDNTSPAAPVTQADNSSSTPAADSTPAAPVNGTVDTTSTVCTVSFQSMGGSETTSQIVNRGNTAQRPADPSRAGYTFAGWCTDSNGTFSYGFNSGVTADLVLYAKWTGNSYQVTLNANGGYIGKRSTTKKMINVTNGETYRSLLLPKRSSYTFTGWFTRKSGGTKITSSSRADLTGNITLYARWAKTGKTSKGKVSSVKSDTAGTALISVAYDKAATGYQVRISTKKSMSSSKQFTMAETMGMITGMKSGRTYYIQSRAYQKDSVTGKKFYGAWSSVRSRKVL